MEKNDIREARRMYLKSKEGRRNIRNCIFRQGTKDAELKLKKQHLRVDAELK